MIFALSVYGLGKHSDPINRNSFSYITERVDNFLADNQNAIQNKTINFQTEQGLIAIGSGGFLVLDSVNPYKNSDISQRWKEILYSR